MYYILISFISIYYLLFLLIEICIVNWGLIVKENWVHLFYVSRGDTHSQLYLEGKIEDTFLLRQIYGLSEMREETRRLGPWWGSEARAHSRHIYEQWQFWRIAEEPCLKWERHFSHRVSTFPYTNNIMSRFENTLN